MSPIEEVESAIKQFEGVESSSSGYPLMSEAGGSVEVGPRKGTLTVPRVRGRTIAATDERRTGIFTARLTGKRRSALNGGPVLRTCVTKVEPPAVFRCDEDKEYL